MELNLLPVSFSSFSISTKNETTLMNASPQLIMSETNDAARWPSLCEFRSHRHESSKASRSSK